MLTIKHHIPVALFGNLKPGCMFVIDSNETDERLYIKLDKSSKYQAIAFKYNTREDPEMYWFGPNDLVRPVHQSTPPKFTVTHTET